MLIVSHNVTSCQEESGCGIRFGLYRQTILCQASDWIGFTTLIADVRF